MFKVHDTISNVPVGTFKSVAELEERLLRYFFSPVTRSVPLDCIRAIGLLVGKLNHGERADDELAFLGLRLVTVL